MTDVETQASTWQNFARTVTAHPRTYIRAADATQVQAALAESRRSGRVLRVVGSGHSYSPIVPTDGTILDIAELAGIRSVDADARRARFGAGSTVKSVGAPLWELGLSLANQGGINAQTLAGAISTATHGSGLAHGSMSSAVTRAEIVTADGSVQVIGEDDDRLDAVRTSIGCLGVLVDLELQLTDAYYLEESLSFRSYAQVKSEWQDLARDHRHVALWWGPTHEALEALNVSAVPAGLPDPWCVKLLDECSAPESLAGVQREHSASPRRGPAYEIYPDVYPPIWDEMEYFVPVETVFDAVDEIRRVYRKYPEQQFPLEVRTIGSESGWLAPAFGRDSASLSVTAALTGSYERFFRDIHRALQEFNARPHWGKLNFFEPEELAGLYPRFGDFVCVRRDLDPDGLFLNRYLREVFA